MADQVITRDEGIYAETQLLIMERHGYQEETYYTFSYSPVPDDEGGIGGLICANTEDTIRVIGERQLATLRELAAGTASSRTWEDACRHSIEALGTNTRDVTFALLFVAREGATGMPLAAASAGTEALHDFAMWPLETAQASGEPHVTDLAGLGSLPQGAWERPPKDVAILPIAPSTSGGHAGALVVGLNPYRRFDAGYRGFLTLVAGQVAAAMANAEAYEQERKRAESLAELDRAKTTFFSNVSHEFRTPLTLMLGPITDLMARAEEADSEEDRTTLAGIHRNGQRLLKLVNTLLDFARIEAGRVQTTFVPTDLAAVTADLAANFRAACEQAGIGLAVNAPTLAHDAWIDRDMWEKIVLNLVSNAFKFTLKGRITVALRERADTFELSVRDTGTGIPAEALPKMFERFYRVEGATGRSHEGSGIGLALVQELVRVHGGTIEVKSVLGEGSEFVVRIPQGHAHLPREHVKDDASAGTSAPRAGVFVEEAMSWLPAAGDAGQVTLAPSEAPRVLVADDNADLRQYLRRLLQGQYRVEVVANGEEALAALREKPFDLVLSDVMMPRLDGFGLVREIRADPAMRSTPIVLLSARAGEEARIAGMASGADDYLVKPFSARELLVRVGALIEAADVRRKANQELARTAAQLEALIDAAPLGIYLLDQDFRIAAVNPIAAPVFGADSVIGRDFVEVIHRLWPRDFADEIVDIFRRTLETGEPYVMPEKVARRADTNAVEYYEWQVHRIPLPGERHGVVCYFREISHVVHAREALRESDRRKDEFLATLSHELRNPLAPIRNSLHLLGLTRTGDASVARVHEMMERQVNHLVRLVDDLLEMSRISRGTLELKREPVELSTIVRNAVETVEPLMQASGHRLEVDLPKDPLWLDGDVVRLGQILGNVLNNSAKYTDRGGRVSVSARPQEHEIVISVRDSGHGIAADQLERIFEKFARGPEQTQGGLGIGLALARRLVQMHGGTIAAHSEGIGCGSEFVIRLPLASAPTTPEGVTGRLGALPSKRILVVDDNRDAGDSLAMILRILGVDVRVARSGPEGLSALESFDADIVLLDIGMPEMDGYEVARRIRARGNGHSPAIVAVTGWGQEQDRRRAKEAGFDHHLVKPADLQALNALLSSL
jgi:PAS domain S-box-containing protein